MTTELTGRHVLAIALTAFAIIVGANLTMLFAATGSFPGLVVKNAYVAGQGWNQRAEAQLNLGWQVEFMYENQALAVIVRDPDGQAIQGLDLQAVVGRPTTDAFDHTLVLAPGPLGYEAPGALDPGVWQIAIRSDRPRYEMTGEILVTGGE